MRNIWNWVKDDAGPITATIAILGGFAAIIQFSVVRPMHQRLAAVNQRFDAQDRRLEDLVEDVSGLRKLSARVTRSETRIDTLTEQLQTADAPSP